MSMPVFATWIQSCEQVAALHLLIDSIREYGGALSPSPILVMEFADGVVPDDIRLADGVTVHGVEVGKDLRNVWYGAKVEACAAAEALATGRTKSLVLLIPECLVIRPPELLVLDDDHDIAVRPVHISNVGSRADAQPDGFWNGVYDAVGVEDIDLVVESFIDSVSLRAYFNSAAFAVDPSLGLMGEWRDRFAALARDESYMSAHCSDDLHRIFLHQAVLCSVLPARVKGSRVRILPPEYGYPYNLHGDVPPDRRATTLNELVLSIYEERSVDPSVADDIAIDEPLRTWLATRLSR